MEAQTVQDILAEVGVQLAGPEDYAALAAKYPAPDPLNGVYVVHLPEFGNGDENVAWLFVNETDADQFCDELNGDEGPVDGSAWVTYEPIAYTWDDKDFQGYRRERLGIEA